MIWLEELQYNSSLEMGNYISWLDGDADNIEVTGSSPVLPTN